MVTSKRQKLRAHNGSTVAAVKRDFRESETAQSAFFKFSPRHDALLKALFEREKVRVY